MKKALEDVSHQKCVERGFDKAGIRSLWTKESREQAAKKLAELGDSPITYNNNPLTTKQTLNQPPVLDVLQRNRTTKNDTHPKVIKAVDIIDLSLQSPSPVASNTRKRKLSSDDNTKCKRQKISSRKEEDVGEEDIHGSLE